MEKGYETVTEFNQVQANSARRHRHALAGSRRILGSPSRRYFWFPLSLLFGLATWGMYLYLGLHTGNRRYFLLSIISGTLYILALVLASMSNGDNDLTGNLAGGIILCVWIGGIIHAVVICAANLDGVANPAAAAERQRNQRRKYGRRLLIKQPALAREIGVGRPDVPGSDHCFLVDFNHASEATLSTVRGVSPSIAHQIVQYREAGGDFSSVNDLVVTLDLSPHLSDRLQNVAVFLHE